VRHAGKIVVIQDGRLVEEGSHGELLERQGLYAHLYDLQSGRRAVDASSLRIHRQATGRSGTQEGAAR